MITQIEIYVDTPATPSATGMTQWMNYVAQEVVKHVQGAKTSTEAGALIIELAGTQTKVQVLRKGENNLRVALVMESRRRGKPFSLPVVGLVIARCVVHLVGGRANIGRITPFGTIFTESVPGSDELTVQQYPVGPDTTRQAYGRLRGLLPDGYFIPYADLLKTPSELLPKRK